MPEITKQDALRWLDYQRQVYNDAIVKAHPEDQRQFAWEVQHINAIEARIKEMTAVEYLEARQEMCVEHMNIDNFPPSACTGCPLDDPHCNCEYFAAHNPRRAVEIVKRWKEEQE